MNVTLDVRGRNVLVVGNADAARRTLRRYRALGAHVLHLPDGLDTALLADADIVVSVGLSATRSAELGSACRAGRTWHTIEPAANPPGLGRVTLVGGGPGNAELLTMGAVEALGNADVVLFDRLAPHETLEALAPGAELIDVGKRPGHHPVAQHDIEALLVERALRGDDVVRLKGGDPYVFGRGGEEVLACRAAGVPVRVLSGVTSAISVPAAAGIPVTQREVSHLFTVVSGHAPLSEGELSSLSRLGGTVVVLMGVGTLPHLSAGLMRHGMNADMPMAIIEQGCSSGQRTTVADLGTIVQAAAAIGAVSPAVIVIGEVVRLAHDADRSAVEVLSRASSLAGSW